MATYLVTILYPAHLDMTNLCTDKMVKIDTDENKAIHSRCKGKAVMRRKPKCGRQTDGHGDSSIPPLTSLRGV